MTTKPDLSHIAEPIRKLAVPISALVEDDKNARVHGGRNLDAIAASLGRFGQVKPIVVQVREDGSRVVRAGNGTLEAARSRLGWTHLAVIETRMTDEEAIAYGIADNQTGALASWDLEVLAEHFSLLADIPDLVGATGFLDAEIAPLLHADFGAVEADISATPSGQSIEVVSARWTACAPRLRWR